MSTEDLLLDYETFQGCLMTKTRIIYLYGPSPQEITRIDNCNVQGHLVSRQEGEQLRKMRRDFLQKEEKESNRGGRSAND